MTTKQLVRMEKQLRNLSNAVDAAKDPSLKAAGDALLTAWAEVNRACDARLNAQCEAKDGGVIICEVFNPGGHSVAFTSHRKFFRWGTSQALVGFVVIKPAEWQRHFQGEMYAG